jgi:hypothetical protein
MKKIYNVKSFVLNGCPFVFFISSIELGQVNWIDVTEILGYLRNATAIFVFQERHGSCL